MDFLFRILVHWLDNKSGFVARRKRTYIENKKSIETFIKSNYASIIYFAISLNSHNLILFHLLLLFVLFGTDRIFNVCLATT